MYSYAELDEKWERKMKRDLVKPMFDLNKPPKKKKKKKKAPTAPPRRHAHAHQSRMRSRVKLENELNELNDGVDISDDGTVGII